MSKRITLFIFIFSLMFVLSAQADILYLTNGDQVSGEFIEETKYDIMIETPAMGRTRVSKKFIEQRVRSENVTNPEAIAKEKAEQKAAKAAADLWQRKISLGYSQAGGNTENNQLNGELGIIRKTDIDEITGKVTAYISRQNEKTDAKKFYGLARYDRKAHEESNWYHFYKVEADQDRFANINYRVAPGVGLGLWLANQEDFKLKAESAIGVQHTNYRGSTKSNTEAIVVPRGYLEAKLFGDLKVIEDISLYPSLEDTGVYRLHSETSLVNPLNDYLSWKFSFIDDYNSDPIPGTKKNDFRLTTGIDVNF